MLCVLIVMGVYCSMFGGYDDDMLMLSMYDDCHSDDNADFRLC